MIICQLIVHIEQKLAMDKETDGLLIIIKEVNQIILQILSSHFHLIIEVNRAH